MIGGSPAFNRVIIFIILTAILKVSSQLGGVSV
jgi:hypothetical protein